MVGDGLDISFGFFPLAARNERIYETDFSMVKKNHW